MAVIRVMTRAALLLIALLPLARLEAQYTGRSFTVSSIPDTAQAGDTVRLRFRLVLEERDLLTDTVPKPAAELPAGVRVLSVEKLRRGPDRTFTGEAAVAFYRPGRREIPAFGVPWVQVVTGHRATVTTGPATIEIASVLPAGNPALRDIREPETPASPGPLGLALGALAAGAAAWYVLRRRRRLLPAEVEPPVESVEPPAPADPYQVALARLARAERGDVERQYQETADALRDYLEAAEEIPARERTSAELLWSLPPRLLEDGLRRLTAQVLGDADLVKFARSRPDPSAAAAHLREARELLRRWHEALAESPEEADAVR